jgi:hypothetical protein
MNSAWWLISWLPVGMIFYMLGLVTGAGSPGDREK